MSKDKKPSPEKVKQELDKARKAIGEANRRAFQKQNDRRK